MIGPRVGPGLRRKSVRAATSLVAGDVEFAYVNPVDSITSGETSDAQVYTNNTRKG
jgi:hypothetical protein